MIAFIIVFGILISVPVSILIRLHIKRENEAYERSLQRRQAHREILKYYEIRRNQNVSTKSLKALLELGT